ncbi:hypothetical protein CL629_01940 [bacterium]|nr:hypothetical protein [bacterium]|tara:strand:+ start:205 stop:411 length:207 start_codon:yes stop_codon:yes gene_type:complete
MTQKEQLLAEKEKIENLLSAYKDELGFGDDENLVDEETDEAEEFATYLGVKDVLQKRLRRIEADLQKL